MDVHACRKVPWETLAFFESGSTCMLVLFFKALNLSQSSNCLVYSMILIPYVHLIVHQHDTIHITSNGFLKFQLKFCLVDIMLSYWMCFEHPWCCLWVVWPPNLQFPIGEVSTSKCFHNQEVLHKHEPHVNLLTEQQHPSWINTMMSPTFSFLMAKTKSTCVHQHI